MKNTEDKYTIQSVMSRIQGGDITFAPSYQRPEVWNREQKSAFMISLLREISIPKLYVRPYDKDGEEIWDIIDGQQRLRTLEQFFNCQFELDDVVKSVDNHDVSKKNYKALSPKLRRRLDDYNLTIVKIENASEDEVCDLFIRLNNGTPLTKQDKRRAFNSELGKFIREVVCEHEFWNVVKINNLSKKEGLSAQVMRFMLANKIVSINNTELNTMYNDYKDFDMDHVAAQNIKKCLNFMSKAFKDTKDVVLKPVMIKPLFWLVYDMCENYNFCNRHGDFKEWFIDFNKEFAIMRHDYNQYKSGKTTVPIDQNYNRFILASTIGTDSVDNINLRYEFMKKSLLSKYQDIVPLDSKRLFNELEKDVIYYRDEGVCHLCNTKCDIKSWHCDHLKPHSLGGSTTIANGAVTCIACNLKKGNKT